VEVVAIDHNCPPHFPEEWKAFPFRKGEEKGSWGALTDKKGLPNAPLLCSTHNREWQPMCGDEGM